MLTTSSSPTSMDYFLLSQPGLPHSSSLLGPNPALSLNSSSPSASHASRPAPAPHPLLNSSGSSSSGSIPRSQPVGIPGATSLNGHTGHSSGGFPATSPMAGSPLRHEALSSSTGTTPGEAWGGRDGSPRKLSFLGNGTPPSGAAIGAGMDRMPSNPGVWAAGGDSRATTGGGSPSPHHHPHGTQANPSLMPAPSPLSLHLHSQQQQQQHSFFHPPHHPSPLHPSQLHPHPHSSSSSPAPTPLLVPPQLSPSLIAAAAAQQQATLPPGDTRTQLFVGNLPFRVRWQDLKDLFRKCGTVLRADVALTMENRSKGFGTVLFANREDAGRAIETYNGFNWQTRVLDVRLDSQDPTGAHALALANAANAANAAAAQAAAAGISPQMHAHRQHLQAHAPHAPHTPSLLGMPPVAGGGAGGGMGTPTMSRRGSAMDGELARIGGIGGPTGGRSQSPPEGRLGVDGFGGQAGQDMARSTSHHTTGPTSPPRPATAGNEGGGVGNGAGTGAPSSTTPMYDPTAAGGMGVQPVMVPVMYTYPGMPPGGLMSFYGGRPAALPIQYANRHLFVGNLPFNCQWQDLKDLFRNAGNILRADVAVGPDGRSRGFGTVLFATPEDAQNALRMYNGYEYNGRQLKVHFDKFAQPGVPGTATPPHVGTPSVGGGGYGVGQHLGMGRSASSSSHHSAFGQHQAPPQLSLDTRSVSSASPLPSPFAQPHTTASDAFLPSPIGRSDSRSEAYYIPGISADAEPLPSPFLQEARQHQQQSFRVPDTWSFSGEQRIDEPTNGGGTSSRGSEREASPTRGPPELVSKEGESGRTSRSIVQRPTSIAMPPPYLLEGGGSMSPPAGKGMAMMTPSMPAFSFQPFPQTPPLMPAQFFSPGLSGAGLGPFSPPVQSPGWSGPSPHPSSMQQNVVPGYNPMFPPSSSYDPTPGAHLHPAVEESLGLGDHQSFDKAGGDEPNGVLSRSLSGAMEQLALSSQPLQRDESSSSSHSSTHDPRVGSGGLKPHTSSLAAAAANQARRASFFGAPGAEKLLYAGTSGRDRLAAADDMSARRASFDSGALARRSDGSSLLGAKTASDRERHLSEGE